MYRPFVKRKLYYRHELNEMQYQNPQMFPDKNSENVIIAVNTGNKNFNAVSSKHLVDLHFNGDSQCLPMYRYDNEGTRHENITVWALRQFQERYQDTAIHREAIFHYAYAVLHHPAYRQKYEINLKREFPRIPFYDDFWKWEAWGKQLMDLHLNYEQIAPYSLKRIDAKPKASKPPITPKAKLKADKDHGIIELDGITVIKGIPKIAWEYKLGNRSALEWILEYYKERKPKDPTILQKFNTYRFADYKEHVIDLLRKVCTVSVETMKIIKDMESLPH